MRNGPKKIIEFAGKFCSFERRRYLCTTKPIRWIHLRVRIRASHARHRGSNPLSTTRLPNGRTQVRPFPVSCFLFPVSCFLFPVSCFLLPVPSVCSLVCGGAELRCRTVGRGGQIAAAGSRRSEIAGRALGRDGGMLPLMNSRAGGSLRQAGRKCRTACRRAEIVSRNPSAGVRPPQTAGLKITAAAS